ncbi:MAG TPA: ThuA domain-containing protein [Chitinophagaceae bacterium]|nr:ThuA domain-containing protein [Chitinophagaceae bacterium]
MRSLVILTALMLFTCVNAQAQLNWKKLNVLIYTRSDSVTHEGKKAYIHDNIAACTAAVQALGKKHGFKTEVSGDPSVFNENNLARFNIVVFASTNNNAFNTDEQRVAFRRFVESGGGVVGLHSVMGTERAWTWFKNMLGGTFSWHASNQVYKIRNIKPKHPAVEGVPLVWEKKDECYFAKEMYPGIEVLMAHDITTLDQKQAAEIAKNAGLYNVLYPAVWYHNFDGGHIWISQLGHDIANYTDPVFVNHIYQGLKYIASVSGKRDLTKAYATERDMPIKY